MKSGFKMRSGNTSSFKMMGSSSAKVDKKPKKSTVAVDGQIEDAQSDYERDSKSTSNNLTKKPVGPVAEKKEVKEEKPNVPTDYSDEYKKGKKNKEFDTREINPGFEDPIKIQALHREGLTPGSQKFSKIANENKKNAK